MLVVILYQLLLITYLEVSGFENIRQIPLTGAYLLPDIINTIHHAGHFKKGIRTNIFIIDLCFK